ncbi:MAG: hypothetical protein A3G66_02100 [Candidatus Levybacteria bacterium RIFCSPLOWO2_12_FULL_39_17]|nr:MAG: hypothetical protein A2689_01230 [Candidatus Levybacteria bacterium RIFCSPHIGHO2_01_FULL_38_96]OGH36049.1 MAG: hypothetical protein A3B43_00455 [Candidatus Levybacteria bacterium RIFCSPLOWO2_01_FULL_38_120]OGH47833.1 MAG: hypothetical protein A3G66_02100 [Candidatus Levybacteria bacterium RIFCSPLOWO2_12_FULL_39_17]
MKLLINNKFKNIFFLILVSLIFVIPLFSSNFYASHDGEAIIARFGAYVKASNDGQFPLRWAGDLNFRYGSPVLIFYYPLPGIFLIPLNAIGISLENTFKIIIGFSFILSFVSFYLWIRELVKDEYAALLGGILYGLTPYHFLNLYVRAGVAELMALSLVPLVFLFIEKASKKVDLRYVIAGGVLYGLLILSHNSVSLLFTPIFLAYSFLRGKNKQAIFQSLSILILGLFISAFFWLPAIVEAKYTNAKLFIDMFKLQFPSFWKLVYSPWGFGPEVNRERGLSPQIGPMNLFLVIISLLFLFKKNESKKLFIFWFVVFLLSTLLILNISTPVWEIVPFLKSLQYPWRIVGISSFAAVVLVSLWLRSVNNFFRLAILAAILIYSIQFLKVNYIPSKPDSFYFNYSSTTYYHSEASPIWTAGDFGDYPKKNIEIISGQGSINASKRKSNIHEFTVKGETALEVLDNTVYFPGWQVLVDGGKTPIEFQNAYHRGLITFRVPKGEHLIKVIFGESPLRLFADLISLTTLFCIFLLILLKSKLEKLILKF